MKSFVFDLGGADLPFLPGQWVDLFVDTGTSIAVGGYSITSSPLQKGTIQLAIKRLPEGVAATYLHDHARVGHTVRVRGGFGDFHYDEGWDGPLVLVAGGIGVTPFMSMLRFLDEAHPEADRLLLYCARTPSELVFREELRALAARNPKFRCVFTVTRPGREEWEGLIGRIDLALLKEYISQQDSLYYLCGPPAMQDDLSAVLSALRVGPSRIKVERW